MNLLDKAKDLLREPQKTATPCKTLKEEATKIDVLLKEMLLTLKDEKRNDF